MKLHETRQIERPLNEVFAFTADFANTEKWDPGVKSARKVGSGPVGVGTRYDVVASFGSSSIPMQYEITDFETDQLVRLVGHGASVHAVDEIRFEARDGGTFVDYTADLSFDNWFRFVSPLLAPVMSRTVGKRALDGLVASLER